MTPERLNELADWLTQSSVEELLDDIDNVAAISEFLREFAKAEPVAWMTEKDDPMTDKSRLSKWEKMGLTVIPLYAEPQVSLPTIEDGTEFERFLAQNSNMRKLRIEAIVAAEDLALEAWQAARKLSAPQVPDEKLLLEAIARGWCHEANSHKEIDASLVVAIAAEVKAMLKGEK